jgi:hypothetical protein
MNITGGHMTNYWQPHLRTAALKTPGMHSILSKYWLVCMGLTGHSDEKFIFIITKSLQQHKPDALQAAVGHQYPGQNTQMYRPDHQ